ncbi:tetratricopeptide repeat protein [Aerococcus sanguinicola]|uniref:Tetratricopeptide repeat protein n=1 Tax=Aerococcus sanguinicola TaxID=119206 RepID=A0A0X8FBF8_9LACT|nr:MULTISPECIES: tetratricopeptide repeat protein [Aerococcus]AMB93442.1 hypothetical protein AWM72_01120 [Aerococcus sanguinicola]MDK7051029.1 tetratricopeptide repeat protein [Aerococcus sanguinicola]OFT94477.1 hypothetical protein HMPREF3090_05805 [Aerococcus sp. HMSC23C02]PKZ20500.1 tetratricopeptide repeat protein [Aerococcus sanguinicola]
MQTEKNISRLLQAIRLQDLAGIETCLEDLQANFQAYSQDQLLDLIEAVRTLGDLTSLLKIYDLAQAAEPGNLEWLLLKAEAKIDQGAYTEAIDDLLALGDDHPYQVEALLMQADAYQMLSLPEVSMVKLQEAQALAPDEAVIRYGIAQLKFDQGDFQSVLLDYRQLLDDADLPDPIREKVEENYLFAQTAVGNFDEALDRLQSKKPEERTEAEEKQLGLLYALNEDYEKAQGILESFYLEDQLTAKELALYAEVKEAFHEDDEALRMLTSALNSQPFDADLWGQRARLYQKLGQSDQALADAQQALALDPDYTTMHELILHGYLAAADDQAALDQVQTMPAESYQSGELAWLVARTYDLNEDFDQAHDYYQKAYPDLKEDASFVYDYLRFMREEGDQAAITHLLDDRPELKSDPSFYPFLSDQDMGEYF